MTKDDENFLSEEDRSLWARVSQTVKRSLPVKKKQTSPLKNNTQKPPQKVKVHEQPIKPFKAELKATTLITTADSRPADTAGSSLDAKTLKRLKQGKINIDETIDLHGMTQQAAHGLLLSRIPAAQNQGKRLVLVITGKGLRSDVKGGVLKKALVRYCETPPLSAIVLKRVAAQPKHGGSGAFYLYLRRKRD